MNDKCYVTTFREAVEQLLVAGEAGLHNHGLCFGLCRCGFGDSYFWMAHFLSGELSGGHLPSIGVMTDLRMNILLILAELDDETILFFRDAS